MTPAEFTAGRKELGLTQSQLAAVMGYVDRAHIGFMSTKGPVSPQAARLMRAYLAGYRPDDWPDADESKSRNPR